MTAITHRMTGREVVLAAVQRETTPRPAWVPYVGCHGGFLLGISAREYLTSADRVVEGLIKARELYQPDGLPVMFDLQIEAETLGCELHWADDAPPSVRTHPLEMKGDWDVEDVGALDPSAGRIPLAAEATRRLREEFGDEVALYGLICGPFTLALHLLGNTIFLEMFDNPGKVQALLMRCAEIGKRMAAVYVGSGADVIAVVDPMTSQISPGHFEQFVAPAMNELYGFIRERGALSSCFVCGDATKNLEAMCRTRCDSLSVDEQIDLAALREVAEAHGKSFGGNLKLTISLLLGTEDDVHLDAIECIDKAGATGFILSPGCDLPYATPPENVAAAGKMAKDALARESARASAKASEADDYADLEIPDYDAAAHVTLDVITLDSESCAPCQYMKSAAEEAAEELGDAAVVREHKIKTREGIGMLVRLGVRNLPTICIDGKPTFESVIPGRNRLTAAIRERLAGKRKSSPS